MLGTFNVALSGLRAADIRLSIAANNIVNISSAGHTDKGAQEAGEAAVTAFQPATATASSTAGGGVVVTATPVNPGTVPIFNPGNPLADSNGFVAYPNVSLAEQMIELKLASLSYEANAKVIETESELLRTLLDSFS